jgi:FkbM family methyltransferase
LRTNRAGRTGVKDDADTAWIALSREYGAARLASMAGQTRLPVRHAEAGGLNWVLPVDRDEPGTLSHRIVHEGWLPLDDIAAVRPFARGEAMLDIGANIGTTSIPRAVLGDFARIYAAEPEPDNFHCLVANVLANGVAGLVCPDRVAVSSQPGTMSLRRASGMGGHHLLAEPGGHDTATVEVVTVDTWLARLGADLDAIRFVKVDTQGWDVRVLEGAQALLARRRAVWQIEVSVPMMKRAGSRAEDLVAQVDAHFTHVRELDKGASKPWVPATQLPDVLARMAERRQFGNVLLLNLPSRGAGPTSAA